VISDINLPAPPEPNARKVLSAVRYKDDLANTKVVASVYIPDAGFRYADARFFLFDDEWKCHQSEGIELQPGEWVDLSWDLRYFKTFLWSRPWKKLLGIQIYVEGYFKGPVYIDDVKIYK